MWHKVFENWLKDENFTLKNLNCDRLWGKISQLMRLWYLSYGRPVKAQASLRIHTVSPEPSLFAHMKYGSRRRARPKIRHLAPLHVWRTSFCRTKNTITSWHGSNVETRRSKVIIFLGNLNISSYNQIQWANEPELNFSFRIISLVHAKLLCFGMNQFFFKMFVTKGLKI